MILYPGISFPFDKVHDLVDAMFDDGPLNKI